MDVSILEEKSSFKMLGLIFSSKLDWQLLHYLYCWNCLQENGALIRFMKFLSPKVALYLYKSTTWPCMKYCCHIWAGASSCYLGLLDKLQKWICRTVGPSLAASLEPSGHRRNVASLSLFYSYYFGRYSSELAQLFPLPLSRRRSTRYSDRLLDFLSPFLDVKRMSMSSVSFLAQLGSGILCLKNAFLWTMILVVLSLELPEIFEL